MRTTRTFLALAAVVALVAAGCGGSSGTANEGGAVAQYADGGTYTMAVQNDPGNLDPLMTVLSVTRLVSHLAYDVLIYQTRDGEFVPGLAESWEISGNEAVFTLVDGVTCSDGSPLTAGVVADNINFVADPENESPLLGVILPAGIKATADAESGTVTVTTPQPDAFLLDQLASMFIVCEAGMADRSKLARETVGTGPWVLTEAVPDDHYIYERRDGYAWGPGGATLDQPGVPDRVEVRVITNPTTTANLLLSGEVNYATVIGPDRARIDAAGVPAIKLRDPQGETFFNQAAGRPGADPAVREALVTGANMAEVGKVATAESTAPSKGLVTIEPKPCQGDTVSGNLPEYDPARAKQILADAGWRPSADGIRVKNGDRLALTFIYSSGTGAAMAAGAELLAKQWRELGVEVNLRAVSSTQLNEVIFSAGNWDAGWVRVGVSLPTQLQGFVSGPVPPDGTNFAHIDNPTYAENAAAAAELTGEEACARWNAAEEALINDLDVTPMFDAITPIFLQHAEATVVAGELHGSSLRLLAG